MAELFFHLSWMRIYFLIATNFEHTSPYKTATVSSDIRTQHTKKSKIPLKNAQSLRREKIKRVWVFSLISKAGVIG